MTATGPDAPDVAALEPPAGEPIIFRRLSERTLSQAPPPVCGPATTRADRIGAVHFGPGAFHRAHQAYYFDRLLERDPDPRHLCRVT